VVNLFMDYETFCAELARHTGRPYEYPRDRTCELDDGKPSDNEMPTASPAVDHHPESDRPDDHRASVLAARGSFSRPRCRMC
jgi:hypothetical protein